jgi:predicted dehydrogenase
MELDQGQRRLRLAVVGGGAGSFIGQVHRMAARLDGHYALVACALSSNPQRAQQAGHDLGFPSDRIYDSWHQLIAVEAKRPDRAEVLAVMTPNDSHVEICMAALDAGFHIVCDKPVAADLASARALAAKVRAMQAEFCATYCYSAYPMVRQARDMIRAGALGAIRQVHLQYVQGNLAGPQSAPGWRQEAARVGGSLVLLDIGTHAFHLGCYVTGLDVDRLCADLGSTRPNGADDDYISALLRFANGARGSLWVTNAAAGSEHGLGFRVHGDLGGLEWQQEEPNRLVHRRLGEFDQVLTRRLGAPMSEGALQSTRVAVGHPEGYLEAFANLYSEFANAVRGRQSGRRSPPKDDLFPSIDDGLKGLAFVDACVRSSSSGRWETLPKA